MLPSPDPNVHETLRPYYAVGGKAITAKDLHDHQSTDHELARILETQVRHQRRLKNFLQPIELSDGSRHYKIYIRDPDQPYLPQKLRSLSILMLHGSDHPGIRRTYPKMKTHFYWPYWQEDHN